MNCYIRPLRFEDARTSYKWRNDPEIWEFTGSKPSQPITQEIEESWMKKVLSNNSEKRFAICIEGSNQYVGNVQLTNICDNTAQFHIFIGEKKFWGQHIGQQAIKQIIAFAFRELHLKSIYLHVSQKNSAAIRVYEKCGFSITETLNDEYKMNILNLTTL